MTQHIHHLDAEFGDVFRVHRDALSCKGGFGGSTGLYMAVWPHSNVLADREVPGRYFLDLDDGSVYVFMPDDMVEIIGALSLTEETHFVATLTKD